VSVSPSPGLKFAPRVGEGSLCLGTEARPRGVHASASPVGVELLASREGVVGAAIAFDGDGLGVVCLKGDGDNGDSGRRKGDARGEP
jgi:hypothetical protein